jgi:tetratricopeptide (TPR) repeat protein
VAFLVSACEATTPNEGTPPPPGEITPRILLPTAWATPTSAPPTARPFRPGDPTATPPGEEITDPNYLAGKEAYQAKDYELVLSLMEKVIATNPDLPTPHWYRGMALYYLGRYDEAMSEMDRALAIDPLYALAYADTGLLFNEMGDSVLAFEFRQRALALDPSLAKVHQNMGSADFNAGLYELALEHFDITVAIDPSRPFAWMYRAEALSMLGRTGECTDSAGRAIQLDPQLWRAYKDRADCRIQVRQYSEALLDLNTYLENAPDDASAWYSLGYAYSRLKDPPSAIEAYSHALAVDTMYHEALINRGSQYIALGEFELALQDYEAAVLMAPVAPAFVGRGDVNLELGHYAEALRDYEAAIAIWPPDGFMYFRLARAYFGLDRYQEAIDSADLAMAIEPCCRDDPLLLEIRARSNYSLGRYPDAIADQTKVIAIQPNAMSCYYRGLMYQAKGSNGDAIADFQLFLASAEQLGLTGPEIEDAERRLAELRG